MAATPPRDPDAQLAWTEGMLIQIARDLELIKDRLGIGRDPEGQPIAIAPFAWNAMDYDGHFPCGCPLSGHLGGCGAYP
jgi:hypothetical protein